MYPCNSHYFLLYLGMCIKSEKKKRKRKWNQRGSMKVGTNECSFTEEKWKGESIHTSPTLASFTQSENFAKKTYYITQFVMAGRKYWKLKEEKIHFGPALKGFSPWSTGSIAFRPIKSKSWWWEAAISVPHGNHESRETQEGIAFNSKSQVTCLLLAGLTSQSFQHFPEQCHQLRRKCAVPEPMVHFIFKS